MERLGIGVVGCGNISMTYLRNAALFPDVEVRACTDLSGELAARRAAEYGIRAEPLDKLLAAGDIDLVLNLTVPNAHYEVSMATLAAGKHVFTEKPLATSAQQGRALVEEARRRGLRIGSAPDTFLGAAGRSARQAVDSGAIGRPITGTAFMMGRGMEHWHPNPAFYYQPGAGPVLDMGPYYLTMLVNLLGPARRVLALSSIGSPERLITAEGPLQGTRFAVGTPTTVNAIVEFASGALVTLGMSWDVFRHSIPPIELHGTEGSLRLPDPDTFGGSIAVSRRGTDWEERPTEGAAFGARNWPYATPDRANYRMLGVADLARSIAENRPARASGRAGVACAGDHGGDFGRGRVRDGAGDRGCGCAAAGHVGAGGGDVWRFWTAIVAQRQPSHPTFADAKATFSREGRRGSVPFFARGRRWPREARSDERLSGLSSCRGHFQSRFACFCVEPDEEFMGEGDANDLFRLAGVQQPTVESFEILIEPPDDLGDHEQDGSHAAAAGPYGALAGRLAAVARQRREAGKLGDGLVGQCPDFRHFSHQARHGAICDAFDGSKGTVKFGPQRVIAYGLGDLGLERADLRRQRHHDRLERRERVGVLHQTTLVDLHHSRFRELAHPNHKSLEALLGRRARLRCLDLLDLSIPGDHPTIDAVGLFKTSHGFGKPSNRPRIDDRRRLVERPQLAEGQSFVIHPSPPSPRVQHGATGRTPPAP